MCDPTPVAAGIGPESAPPAEPLREAMQTSARRSARALISGHHELSGGQYEH